MMMYKSKVYRGDDDVLLGEVEIYPTTATEIRNQNQKMEIIRISHMSQPTERCSPLAVLHTITSSGSCGGVSFKMESSQSLSPDAPIFLLHASCLRESKTAVVSLGQEELHLVAMYSSSNERQYPCFWGFIVASGLYDSCLVMLNLRCLGIVFDLDETLVVANTTRSFEDRIEAIQRKLNFEVDPQRISGMLAEIKRYQEDKALLRQYIENDQVVENGRVIKAQSEVVPAVSDNHQPIIRPIVRFQEKNIVLTRINPLIRDTSVLVRLRPAWEDLRNYLTAKGRKRFEVYVCTMAERDYALEMWRLLDPELNLITSDDLLNRIVCVKSGVKKSLFNVFKNGSCHPRMALVIDDRLKVWDEKDQARVHVVPAFLPYYAPLAEANNSVPTLCVARNVACNVRGGFFKDFDDSLLQRIPEISYEDDINEILSPPDVSNYLVSEEEALNLNKETLAVDGIPDTEVERRLKDVILGSLTDPSMLANLDARLAPLLQTITSSSGSAPVTTSQVSAIKFPVTQPPQASSPIQTLVVAGPTEPSRQSSPAREEEEGEVPESELDPDTRRRMLILQHGQDTRDQLLAQAALAARPPVPVAAPQPPQSRGNWFPVEDDISPGKLGREIPKEFPSDLEAMHVNKFPPQPPAMFPKSHPRDDRLRFNQLPSNFPSFSGEEAPLGRPNSINRNMEFEAGQCVPFAETPVGCIMDIATKCGTKVEFRPILIGSNQLQFAMEVWFAGEKVGEGAGRTRREAQHVATEISLKNLADRYLSQIRPDPNFMHGDGNRFPNASDNGFINDVNSFGYQRSHKEESMPFSSSSDPRMEGSRRMMGSVSALKELCMMEGLGLNFQGHPPVSVQGNEVFAQVEIDGQVLGKGVGLTWDEAKIQAAEKALVSVKSMLGQYGQKRQNSPRSAFQGMPSKRLKQEFPRALQRIPSARYPKNIS